MCSCKLTHVGKTSQKFTERTKQHVPDKLIDGDLTHTKSESAITRHLKDSAECVPSDRADMQSRFSIVSSARSKCHLYVLEAVHPFVGTSTVCSQGVCASITAVLNHGDIWLTVGVIF